MNKALINSEGSKIAEPNGRFLIASNVTNILIKSKFFHKRSSFISSVWKKINF